MCSNTEITDLDSSVAAPRIWFLGIDIFSDGRLTLLMCSKRCARERILQHHNVKKPDVGLDIPDRRHQEKGARRWWRVHDRAPGGVVGFPGGLEPIPAATDAAAVMAPVDPVIAAAPAHGTTPSTRDSSCE